MAKKKLHPLVTDWFEWAVDKQGEKMFKSMQSYHGIYILEFFMVLIKDGS